MRVTVKLFASLAQDRPGLKAGSPFEVDLPDMATTRDLLKRLELPLDQVKVIFVNGRARPMSWPLSDRDEVGVFPPVGGG